MRASDSWSLGTSVRGRMALACESVRYMVTRHEYASAVRSAYALHCTVTSSRAALLCKRAICAWCSVGAQACSSSSYSRRGCSSTSTCRLSAHTRDELTPALALTRARHYNLPALLSKSRRRSSASAAGLRSRARQYHLPAVLGRCRRRGSASTAGSRSRARQHWRNHGRWGRQRR